MNPYIIMILIWVILAIPFILYVKYEPLDEEDRIRNQKKKKKKQPAEKPSDNKNQTIKAPGPPNPFDWSFSVTSSYSPQDPFGQFRKQDKKMANALVDDLKKFQLSQMAPGERELASQLRKGIGVLEEAFSQTSNPFFKEKADELRDIADQLELHADTGNCAYSYSEMLQKVAVIQAQIDALPTNP